MELFETSTGEWNSFNGDSSEEADFMVQLLCNDYSDEQDPCLTLGTPSSSTWPFHESTMNMTAYGGGGGDSSYYCSDITNSSTHNLYYHHPQEVNYTSHSSPIIMANNDNTFSMNLLSTNQQNDCSSIKMFLDNVIEEPVSVCFKQETSNGSLSYQSCEDPRENFVGKRKLISSEPNTTTEDDINLLQTSKRKKQSQVSEDHKLRMQAEKNKKNGESKKNQKLEEDEKEMKTNSGGTNIKNSCSYSSEEDESNASEQDINGGSISRRMSRKNDKQSLKGRTRASRGSATDPQSLYARKRRERINERLRVLQNLVPNGTKVDISTMLEEAVQYVKFLQLQIKLLSSDDHWMYSPIAYNGMDIGLGSKIPSTR